MTGISLAFDLPLARVTLSNEERRNAISLAMWRGFPGVCRAIEERDDALVALLAGAGDNFSAGADISQFGEVFRDRAAAHEYNGAIQAAMIALREIDRPTLAILKGATIGGGLALALACDLRFCALDAHLAIPPAKLGLLYGEAETRRLVELIGPARAKDLLFSGRRISAQEALMIGLVDRVAESAELDAMALDYALAVARLSQVSVRGAKRCVAALAREDGAAIAALVESAALGPDFVEGLAAHAQKRTPNFRAAQARQPKR